jgi:hypothetical protein
VAEGTLGFTEREFLLFFLVLVRMTGLFILAPLFGHASVPARAKAGLAFACALVVYPMMAQTPFEMPTDVYELTSDVARELFVGATLGFVSLLVLAAAQYGGEMIDTQIGFSLANIVDPSFGQQVSLLGQFHYLVAMMVYLAVDGHHYLIGALMRSYSVIPIGGAGMSSELFSPPHPSLFLGYHPCVEVGIDAHLLAWHGVESKPCRNLGHPACTVRDHDELYDHENDEDNKAYDVVPSDYKIPEGVYDRPRISTQKYELGCGDVKRQSQQCAQQEQ